MATAPIIRQEEDLDITDLLHLWREEGPEALGRLMPEVVDELHKLAHSYFHREAPEHTLQPTALVNEVYLRLTQGETSVFHNRSQFYAFAARLMREILVDYARARRSNKRGGHVKKVRLEEAFGVSTPGDLETETLLAIDGALDRLGALDPRQRSIVELRYFMGLTLREIAESLDVSLATVERGWSMARRWLAREISAKA